MGKNPKDGSFLTEHDKLVVERNKRTAAQKKAARSRKPKVQAKKAKLIKFHEHIVPEGYSSKGKKDNETNLLPAVTHSIADITSILKYQEAGHTFVEIAKHFKISESTVVRILKEYKQAIRGIEGFKTYRGDLLADMQRRILNSISDLDIKRAPFGVKILALCHLYDKERLENDLSTANVATLHDDIASLKGKK